MQATYGQLVPMCCAFIRFRQPARLPEAAVAMAISTAVPTRRPTGITAGGSTWCWVRDMHVEDAGDVAELTALHVTGESCCSSWC